MYIWCKQITRPCKQQALNDTREAENAEPMYPWGWCLWSQRNLVVPPHTWEPENPTESLDRDGSMETLQLWAASFGSSPDRKQCGKGKIILAFADLASLLAQSPSVLWLQLHWYQNQHLKLSPWTRGHWLCRNFLGFWGHIGTTEVGSLPCGLSNYQSSCPSMRDRYSGLLCTVKVKGWVTSRFSTSRCDSATVTILKLTMVYIHAHIHTQYIYTHIHK